MILSPPRKASPIRRQPSAANTHPQAATSNSNAPSSCHLRHTRRPGQPRLLRLQTRPRKAHNAALICLAHRRCDVLFAMPRDNTYYPTTHTPIPLHQTHRDTPAELREFLAEKAAKWQLPEQFAFIDEVPKTSVGKFDKKPLRTSGADGGLETSQL